MIDWIRIGFYTGIILVIGIVLRDLIRSMIEDEEN